MNGTFARRLGEWLLQRDSTDDISLRFQRNSNGSENLLCEAITATGDVRRRVIPEKEETTRLLSYLRYYGRHAPWCTYVGGSVSGVPRPELIGVTCTCGLRHALAG